MNLYVYSVCVYVCMHIGAWLYKYFLAEIQVIIYPQVVTLSPFNPSPIPYITPLVIYDFHYKKKDLQQPLTNPKTSQK